MANYLAAVSSRAEIGFVESFAKRLSEDDRLVVLYYPRLSGSVKEAKNVFSKTWRQYLSEKELKEIEEKTLFFVKNWYRLDKGFEKALFYSGIQLGKLPLAEVDVFFRETIGFAKALENALVKEKPEKVICGKRSIAGLCVKEVSKKCGAKNFLFSDLPKEKMYRKHANVSSYKFKETLRRIPKLVSLAAKGFGKNKNTVFVRSRGYLDALVDGMEKDPEIDVFPLDDALLLENLKPLGLFSMKAKKKRARAKYEKLLRNYAKSPGFRKEMQFEGIFLGELFWFKLQQFAELQLPEFEFLADYLQEMIEKRKPKAVVLWNESTPFEKICAIASKNKGIGTLVVQHGVIIPKKHAKEYMRGYVPVAADRIAVWGPLPKKILEEAKVPAQKIVLTGFPKFDLLHKKRFKPEELRNALGLGKEKMVVLATQPFMDSPTAQSMVKQASVACRKLGCRLVVKVHPAEGKGKYEAIVKGLGSDAIVLQNSELYELLKASDALIVHSSTIGIEAMLLGTPVIFFEEKPGPKSLFASIGCVPKARNQEQLLAALDTALGRKSKKLQAEIEAFAKEIDYLRDGKATSRVIELVKGLMR